MFFTYFLSVIFPTLLDPADPSLCSLSALTVNFKNIMCQPSQQDRHQHDLPLSSLYFCNLTQLMSQSSKYNKRNIFAFRKFNLVWWCVLVICLSAFIVSVLRKCNSLEITQDNYSASLKTVLRTIRFHSVLFTWEVSSLCASAYPLFYSYSDDSFSSN